MGVNVSAGFEHFDVSVHGMHVFHVIQSGNAQRAVDRADVFDVHAMRNMNGIFDRDLHSLVLRIPRRDGDSIRARVDLNRHAFEIASLLLSDFHRVNLDFVAIPALNLNRAVDVLQFERAARLERIGLVKIPADGIAGSGPKCAYKRKAKSKNCPAETVT